MTKIEALELELAARKMVEGTKLDWQEVVRRKDLRQTPVALECYSSSDIELVLGIIEGKPVWEGDIYYHKAEKLIAGVPLEKWFYLECSWNPPKPKTVTVELSMTAATVFGTSSVFSTTPYLEILELTKACRKALENLK